jgi:hypothetical protein
MPNAGSGARSSYRWCVGKEDPHLSLDNNEVDRIVSAMEMKLSHKWEFNEPGGLDLYIEDRFPSQEDVYRR